jgi:glycosyltransferase involved in cell wall biosynthesis
MERRYFAERAVGRRRRAVAAAAVETLAMSANEPDPSVSPNKPIRLCVMTTIGVSIQFLYGGRLEYLQAHGFDVTVVCASSELDDAIRARGVRLHTVPFTRAITVVTDLRALWDVWRFLRRERFDLVEVGTPKAALIGTIAARLARVPCVINLVHGLAYEGRAGLAGRIVRLSTALPCRLAHCTIGVSPSVREVAQRDGVCDSRRMRIIGRGSCNGVDRDRFSPASRRYGPEIRARHDIPAEAVVGGYVGRMTRDKGLVELATAFRTLHQRIPGLILLLVGGYEERDRPPADVVEFLATCPAVRHVPWQADPVPYYGAFDMLVLPSHREGLGVVLLEAAALGLPAISTDATGCRDALVDGETGIQVPVGDAERLAAAIERLAMDGELRRRLGVGGRDWVVQHFDQERVWRAYAEEYRRLHAATQRGRVRAGGV